MPGTANEYPLLRNSVLVGIIREFKTDITLFEGAPWCPATDYPTDTIEWDIVEGAMGMTPAVYPGAPSPIQKHPRIAHKSFKTVQWREKFVLDENDLMYLRQPGTYDQNYGQQIIADRLRDLNTRVETRLEYLRWSMLAGSLTVTYPDAVTQTVDYEVPGGRKPTVATPWATIATADPMKNVSAWKLLFRGTPVQMGVLKMNQVTFNYLPTNAAVRSLIQYQFGYDLVRSGNLVPSNAISQAFDGTTIEIYDGGYIDDRGTFNPFIADDVVICLPKSTPEKWCQFLQSPNMHHGGQTPQPGKFARPIWKLDDDPISVEVLGGVYGLPVMYHCDWHLYCDVS
jgi:hypothetical protein